MDSTIIKGMVIEQGTKSACTYKESTKVAIFTCSLDSTQTETKGTVLLHDAEELMNYNQSEEDFVHGVIKGLHEMGVGVVIVGEKVSEMAIHYVDKYNMVCLKIHSKWTLRRLCRAVRARPVVTLVCPNIRCFLKRNKCFCQYLIPHQHPCTGDCRMESVMEIWEFVIRFTPKTSATTR